MLSTLLSDAQEKFDATLDYLRSELSSIRTGRATPVLIEGLPVSAYGSEMLLKELAAISAPEPYLLLVSPWDQSIIEDIEKALRLSSLHLNPVVDEGNIKVPIPELSEERRLELIKLVSQKCEETKVAIRNIRHEKIKSAEEMKDEGKVSEDELIRFKKQLQEMVEGINKKVDQLRTVKEKELGNI